MAAHVSRPLRVDTLRDTLGDIYTSSYFWLAVQRTGTVVGLDQDDKHLTRFDTLGRATRVAMRKGSGPGEAQYPSAIFLLPNDSVGVWDASLRRIAHFDSSLNFARSELFTQWDFVSANLDLVGRFADGRWVAKASSKVRQRDVKFGVAPAVDSVRLVVGTSNHAPVVLIELTVRRGVDVVLPMNGGGMNVFKLRANEFRLGGGVVCDSGVVLVDEMGVRRVDWRGAIVSREALRLAGDTLRTAGEIDDAVKSLLWPPVDTSVYASSVRELLRNAIGRAPIRYARPAFDINGALWYDTAKTRYKPPRLLVRDDSERANAMPFAVEWFTPDLRIAGPIVAASTSNENVGEFGLIYRFSDHLTDARAARFGACSAAFTY